MASADDLLFESKNYFYLGNYQGAINEINKKSKAISDKGGKSDADFYLYRSYIAQGKYELVQSEIKNDNTSPTLQGLKLYASYLQNPTSNKEITNVTVKEWIKDGIVQHNFHLQVIIGSIFLHLNEIDDALRLLHTSEHIEGLALLIQIYLKIDRVDLAEKAYSTMKTIDIDATPSLLSSAWINLSQGEDKQIKNALLTFEELSEKYGQTPLLLNGQASSLILLKRFEDAESLLLTAIEKNPNDTETISNLINCSINLKKTDSVNIYLSQLKSSPNSSKYPWFGSVQQADDFFERSKSRYTTSV